MDTAVALRRDAGLPFVAAPVPGRAGRRSGWWTRGTPWRCSRSCAGPRAGSAQVLPERERAALVDMLAALHQSTPACPRAAVSRTELPRRADLEEALGELGRPWRAGPFAEPARALLAGAGPRIRARLAAFDRLAGAARDAAPVITHGEPHPGNVLRAGPDRILVDWDTVALGPPERDLWLVTGETAPRRCATPG